MSNKPNISFIKVARAIVTLLLTGFTLVAILSTAAIQKKKPLSGMHIHIKNEQQQQFVDKKRLFKTIVNKNHLKKNETSIEKINVKAIEEQTYENPWVKNAEVYLDKNQNLHIYITQHTPSARLFFENAQTYYLNENLELLPASEKFAYYTAVVTNVPWYAKDSMNKATKAKILFLVKLIEKDSFWNAQTEQIAMTPDGEFELYPVLGTHKIILGDTSLLKEKLENVLGFYKATLNKIGWDKYEILDARFKNQIVASPSLPWKLPPKAFISNMDWVKTIMGDQYEAAMTKAKVKAKAKADITTPKPTTPKTTTKKTATPAEATTQTPPFKPATKKKNITEKKPKKEKQEEKTTETKKQQPKYILE